MRRLALLALFLSVTASAQTTSPALLRIPYLSGPPNVAESVWLTFRGSTYYDSTLSCPRWTADGHTFDPCVANLGHVSAAQQNAEDAAAAELASATATIDAAISAEQSARASGDSTNASNISSVSTRVAALESTSATQTQLASAVSGLDARLDAIEAVDYETQAEADAAHASLTSSIGSNTSSISTLNSQVATLATTSSVTALDARVATLEANSVTTTALNTALAGLQKRACGSANITGLSVPLAGISTETAIVIAGVPVGTSCDAGSNNFQPLGARPEVIVTTAGTARLRFVSNGGLLSLAIAIPNGTYRVCCDL